MHQGGSLSAFKSWRLVGLQVYSASVDGLRFSREEMHVVAFVSQASNWL